MSLSRPLDQQALSPPALAPEASVSWRERLRTLSVLFKLRIVALLLLTAVGGAFLGAQGWPGLGTLTLLLITGGLAAAGSSATNQYLEQETDQRMLRTRHRPLVAGAIAHPEWVPYVAAAMVFLPVVVVAPWKPALAFFLLLGAFIYVVIYTLWLKPRTLWNIVIGGAAGSAAVLSGSAAVGRWDEPGALLLALLIFLWTPTHFWSLALVYKDDYARGGVPMLPTRTTPRVATAWIAVHTLATAAAALALAAHPALGWLYAVPVALATLDLVARNVRLLRRPERKEAFDLFKASNVYLALVIFMILLDTLF